MKFESNPTKAYSTEDAELYRASNDPIQLKAHPASAELYKTPNIPVKFETDPTKTRPEEVASSCKLTKHIVNPGHYHYLLLIINRGKRYTFTH